MTNEKLHARPQRFERMAPSNKKTLVFVDFAKFLFAIGVVGIHSGCLSGVGIKSWLVMHGILRLAVPFFFCAAGYFFYRSLKKSADIKNVTKNYIKRLLIPFAFWLLANLPLYVYQLVSDGRSMLEVFRKIIQGIVFYQWGAMWFVSALIVAIVLVVQFYKNKKLKQAVIVGFVLYLVGLLFNTYYFAIIDTPLRTIVDGILSVAGSMRNGLFEGLFFVSVGMYASKLQAERRIKNGLNFIVLVLSYIALLIEIILVRNLPHADDHSLFAMFAIVIPSLFVFLSGLPNLKMKTIVLRNYSTGIYFSHRFFLAIVVLAGLNNSSAIFFVTLFFDVVVLFILYRIDNRSINYLIK